MGLVLLGHAGHHGHDIDLLRVDALLLGVIGLDQGRHHAHRRAAGRSVRDQLGIEPLQEVDPARRAGGDHRQRAFLEPGEELVGLLDDRQVGGEVGVEDGVEAQPPQGGDHLAGARRAGRQAETLADGRADRGGRLHDDVHFRIGDGVPHAAGAPLLQEGRGGADVDALPALDADRFVHVRPVGRGDDGLEAAALLAEVVDALDLAADADAAAAEHALLRRRGRRSGSTGRSAFPCGGPRSAVPARPSNRPGSAARSCRRGRRSGSPWGGCPAAVRRCRGGPGGCRASWSAPPCPPTPSGCRRSCRSPSP